MKIACVSISRSDWNALGMVAMALREQGADVDTHTLTGHEAPEMLEADGFTPLREPPRHPDMIVLCGDRYATAIAAVQAAHDRIPIAHLAGGDITEGSTDDSYRHAITKLAHLHFPTHEHAAQRILQMGEEPWRVMNHGSASIDRIKATPLMSKGDTWAAVGLSLDAKPVALINCQPDTMGPGQSSFMAVNDALHNLPEFSVVIVGANDDPGGQLINGVGHEWAALESRVRFIPHMPGQLYLSMMKHCDVMVGNSSSAYYEAPLFGTPVVDVGERQAGRPGPICLARVPAAALEIEDAIRQMMGKREPPEFMFGSGNAAPAIAKAILSFYGQRDRLLRKKFVRAPLTVGQLDDPGFQTAHMTFSPKAAAR